MLVLKNVKARYGRIEVLKEVSMEVPQGSIVTLLGANGAGKTTTLRAVAGLVQITSGEVRLGERSLVGRRPDKIVRLGISMVPEGRQLFLEMTVEENLEMGAFIRRDRSALLEDLDWVFHLFPRLRERKRQIAGTLSGGEQQMLAIGRALMTRPSLMLLDEPSLGLAPALVDGIFDTIVSINKEGTSILLVEQNAQIALDTADYAYVLETGKISLHGPARELAANKAVQESYLGVQVN